MEHPDIWLLIIIKSDRVTQFFVFLVWLFRLFIFEKAPRRTANNNHEETDSLVLSNHWFFIALKVGLLAIVA